ncbi:hypothetical protein GCM10020369_37920 [Cryptosporangium minutisporangium]|uniref:Uncharacterized protein n=1 Tax=Cryptosporangium minutisporangium TaxID=113569 RepID=A0ABP6SZ95_9ACTN
MGQSRGGLSLLSRVSVNRASDLDASFRPIWSALGVERVPFASYAQDFGSRFFLRGRNRLNRAVRAMDDDQAGVPRGCQQ